MDLGATVCLARIPRCDVCPLAAGCPSRGSRDEPRRKQRPLRGLVPATQGRHPAGGRRSRGGARASWILPRSTHSFAMVSSSSGSDGTVEPFPQVRTARCRRALRAPNRPQGASSPLETTIAPIPCLHWVCVRAECAPLVGPGIVRPTGAARPLRRAGGASRRSARRRRPRSRFEVDRHRIERAGDDVGSALRERISAHSSHSATVPGIVIERGRP